MSTRKKNRPVHDPAWNTEKTITVTEYTEEWGDRVVNLMCAGQLLNDICTPDGTPTPTIIRQWAVNNPEFGKKFDKAKVMLSDALFEEAVTIGRSSTSAATDRLRVDTLLKACAVLQPEKYGDKKEVRDLVAVNIHTTLEQPKGTSVITSGPYIVDTEKGDAFN